MQRKTYIGIDPGSKGALVKRTSCGNISIYPIEKVGESIDLLALATNFCKMVEGEPNVCVILEDVHAIHGSGAKATFNFGKINGFLEGLVYGNQVRLVKIAPKRWQKEMHVGVPAMADIKNMSIYAAKMLFPKVDLRRTTRSKKDDDNIADALLLSEYAIRKGL